MHVNKPSKTKNSTAKRLASTLTLAEDEGKERFIHATFTIEPDIHKRFKMESVRSGVPMSRMLTEWIKKHCPEQRYDDPQLPTRGGIRGRAAAERRNVGITSG